MYGIMLEHSNSNLYCSDTCHNNDSESFIRSIFNTLDSLIDIISRGQSFADSDLDIISVSDYSSWYRVFRSR